MEPSFKTGVPLIPITISGARELLPMRGFPALGFGEVTITVHDPIPTEGREIEDLMRVSHDVIASSLRDCDFSKKSSPADKKSD